MQERSVLVNEVQTILFTDPTDISVDPKWTAVDHDDVIKWKHFPPYRTFVRKIHRSPVNSPHKGQRRGALVFWYPCLHQELSKQWRRRWFETPSRSFDVIVMLYRQAEHDVSSSRPMCTSSIYLQHFGGYTYTFLTMPHPWLILFN